MQAAEMGGERAWEASELRLLAAQAGQVLLVASRMRLLAVLLAAIWILRPAEWTLE